MIKIMSNINLQEPQRNRNATANFVNLIMTSTVKGNIIGMKKGDNLRKNKFSWRTNT